MRVLTQGSVRVNAAEVAHDFGACVLVSVDLLSKYADVDSTSTGKGCAPTVYLAASANTTDLDKSKDIDSLTEIAFHEHKGWDIFCVGNPTRYTMTLALVDRGPTSQIDRRDRESDEPHPPL